MVRAILPLLLFTLPAYAQVEMQRSYADTAPHFYFRALNFKSDSNQSRVDFYFQIPYNRLHFIRSGNEFISKFEITLRAADAREKTTLEKSWEEKATCSGFDETLSANILSSCERHFILAPGNYTLYVTVSEPGSEESFTEMRRVVVRDYSAGTPSMSDIMILSAASKSKKKYVIVPSIQGNVISERDSFPVFYEVYAPAVDSAFITSEIVGNGNKIVASTSSWIRIKQSPERVFAEISKAAVPMGSYKLNVSIRVKDGSHSPAVASSSCLFSIRHPQLPPTITDLDKAADEMMFVASSSTIDSIKSAADEATKVKRFVSFWNNYHSQFSPDGRTSMEEYYNRVAYANKQFKHFFEGWNSDRGMVYILFGPPDNVERYPFNLDSKPYEIWHYYMKARHFLFVDETGFGDYRLRNPIWSGNSPQSGMDFNRK